MTRITRRLIALAGTAGAICALGATTAGATITVNDTTPTNGQRLTATVRAPPTGTTRFTVAECNVGTPPADWGKDCNGTTAVPFTTFVSPSTRVSIVVNSTFTNTSFVPGASPTLPSTVCKNRTPTPNYQCAVVVSWYDNTPRQLGSELVNITF